MRFQHDIIVDVYRTLPRNVVEFHLVVNRHFFAVLTKSSSVLPLRNLGKFYLQAYSNQEAVVVCEPALEEKPVVVFRGSLEDALDAFICAARHAVIEQCVLYRGNSGSIRLTPLKWKQLVDSLLTSRITSVRLSLLDLTTIWTDDFMIIASIPGLTSLALNRCHVRENLVNDDFIAEAGRCGVSEISIRRMNVTDNRRLMVHGEGILDFCFGGNTKQAMTKRRITLQCPKLSEDFCKKFVEKFQEAEHLDHAIYLHCIDVDANFTRYLEDIHEGKEHFHDGCHYTLPGGIIVHSSRSKGKHSVEFVVL